MREEEGEQSIPPSPAPAHVPLFRSVFLFAFSSLLLLLLLLLVSTSLSADPLIFESCSSSSSGLLLQDKTRQGGEWNGRTGRWRRSQRQSQYSTVVAPSARSSFALLSPLCSASRMLLHKANVRERGERKRKQGKRRKTTSCLSSLISRSSFSSSSSLFLSSFHASSFS